jgi:hypothetical protein
MIYVCAQVPLLHSSVVLLAELRGRVDIEKGIPVAWILR